MLSTPRSGSVAIGYTSIRLGGADSRKLGLHSVLPGRPSKIRVVSPLHSTRQPSWGRRIGIALGLLVALALAGYVGSVVGPHFHGSSTPSSASSSTLPSTTTTSMVSHASVTVLVANGTAQPNAAGHFAQVLQQQGWNIAAPKNTTSPASTTTIFYAPSQQQAATLVASELGVPATAVQPMSATVPVASTTGIDIVVIIGPDLAGSGFPATTAPATTVPAATGPATTVPAAKAPTT